MASERDGLAVLLEVLDDRGRLAALTDEQWNALLMVADASRLLPRLAIETEHLTSTLRAPGWAHDRLAAARVKGRQYEREIRWEIACVQRALAPAGVDPVFLKGAAYVAAAIPCGVGRVVADVDILVAETALADVEAALLAHGWEFEPLEAYDERYYREWMHELPPMRHRQRGTMLDVHHRILPRTGRLHPPTSRLLERAETAWGVRVLCPAHRLLHAAAHMFQDGEVTGGLRDLADIASLALDEDDFWRDVSRETDALGLGRPLYYAVRYAQRIGPGRLPKKASEIAQSWAPSGPARLAMDALVGTSLRPGAVLAGAASGLLVARSHWLKMPPALLAAHVWSKVTRRSRPAP
jgi:hypothetical protein